VSFALQEASLPGGWKPQASALLRCISQLNADTWAQVLLPKLIAQGSTADFALSCTQLRDLCYSSRQSLKLGALLASSDSESLLPQVQSLPAHFPNCSAVSLEIKSYECCNTLPYIMPSLAGGCALFCWQTAVDASMPCALLYGRQIDPVASTQCIDSAFTPMLPLAWTT
jgi:hypothetical protein